jgi:hypothetical protein
MRKINAIVLKKGKSSMKKQAKLHNKAVAEIIDWQKPKKWRMNSHNLPCKTMAK